MSEKSETSKVTLLDQEEQPEEDDTTSRCTVSPSQVNNYAPGDCRDVLIGSLISLAVRALSSSSPCTCSKITVFAMLLVVMLDNNERDALRSWF